ncbi:Cyclic nucleotide-binding domain-containing protein [Abeliophyllum distichum]|uniref:Cyclic nucleotide-binding domain-containing protein n=1 Tax=Abeliophyllum distichum TaxID=126358 RepID=A0ABD1RWN0_9LAMI
MAYSNSKSVRFQDDVELANFPTVDGDNVIKVKYKIDGTRFPEPSSRKGGTDAVKSGKSLKAKVLSRIFVRFRTAYVAPSSRVFGRGELVIDSSKIAIRYLQKSLWLDVIAALPLPQDCPQDNLFY